MIYHALVKNKLKIGFRLFPFMLLISVILLGALIAVNGVVLELLAEDETSPYGKKMVMAVSGDYENTLLSSAAAAISLMDYSKYSFDIKSMDADKAKRKLENGEVTAWIYVPKGFAEAFDSGQDLVKLVFTYSADASNIGKMLTYDVMTTASGYISVAHSSIFNFIYSYEKTGHYTQKVVDDFMNDEILAIVSRGDAFDINKTGKTSADGEMATAILCGLLVFFLLLMGTIAIQAFGERNRAVEKRLYINGMGAASQSVVDFLVLFMVEELLVIGDGVILYIASRFMSFSQQAGIEGETVLAVVFTSVPIIFFMAAMQLFIYELMGSGVGGVMANFFVAVFIGFLSGCLYPLKYFPEVLQNFAKALPVNMSVQYIYNIIENNNNYLYGLFIMLYAFLFIAFSVLIRKKKLYDSH